MPATWKKFAFSSGFTSPYGDWRTKANTDGYTASATDQNAGHLRATADTMAKITVPADTVIMAIIDDAMGFANERFRQGITQSRIEAIWIMDANEITTAHYGAVLHRADTDALLAQFKFSGVVDEEALYRHLETRFDLYPDMRTRASHGTHSLDLLAGTDFRTNPTDEKLQTRPILAVQLPRAAIADSSGTRSEAYILDAINWILENADRFETADGDPVPLVCSFSFGLYAGPHDGSSIIEQAIARIAARPLSALTVPAGNSFQSRTHAQFDLGPNSQSLTCTLAPDNKLPSFIEFWLPAGAFDNISILLLCITTPDGTVLAETEIADFENGVAFDHGGEWCDRHGKSILRSYHRLIPSNGAMREQVMIAILPTACGAHPMPTAASGDWKISLSRPNCGADAPALPIDAWIQRGGAVFGHPLMGRQSQFKDPNYVKYTHGGFPAITDSTNTSIKRAGTLSALASAKGAVVVGGYQMTQDNNPPPLAAYSSAGSALFADQLPDIAAPTEQGQFARGILASGSMTGSTVALSGTSSAAPQVGAYIADQLAGCTIPPTNGIKEMIRAHARDQDPNHPIPKVSESLDFQRLGSGRLRKLEDRLSAR